MTRLYKPKGVTIVDWIRANFQVQENGCIYVPFRKAQGYPGVRTGGKNVAIIRLLMSPPQGTDVCHTCDDRACVNEDHLFIGTRRDNMQDAKSKGRHAANERHGHARLSDVDVTEIRTLRSQGWLLRELCSRFSVSMGAVSMICNHKRRQ